jgi:hypothetical protein
VSAAMRRLVLLAAVVLVAAGCGSRSSSLTTEAQTEGLYMDAGPLLYQVQISRYLNPNDPEDAAYLTGLPAGTPIQPAKGETWFGVFIQVRNPTDQTQNPTDQFSIKDTQGAEFQPIALNPKLNPFAYVAAPLGPGGLIPGIETPAYNGPIQGSLILFKLKTSSLQNRPLTLKIDDGAGGVATVDLDL